MEQATDMQNNTDICKGAEEFALDFFKVYLEQRNFPLVISMLSKNVTWFGTGAHEVCGNYQDALRLLEEEQSSWDGKFKISGHWLESLQLSQSQVLVYGEFNIVEDGLNTILASMNPRFSLICSIQSGVFKTVHMHFSTPNIAQEEDEFIHINLVKDYNIKLEEKLQERTAMLKNTMMEFEILTNNIAGGVEICGLDDKLTVKYISEGFTALTGYTLDDIQKTKGGAHINLLHTMDIGTTYKEVSRQLKSSNAYSVEYRIISKNGDIVWVMDKGTLIQSADGGTDAQSILTDITSRKRYEEALRLSEKRYEIALRTSDITMFEYNVITKELLFYDDVATMYNVPKVVPDGVTTFVNTGIIEPISTKDYIEMYDKIHKGAKEAKCYVKTKDAQGHLHDYELCLTNVFDNDGKPIRAIGVRTNISNLMNLQKEQDFGKNLVSDKVFVFEADLGADKIEYLNSNWLNKFPNGLEIAFSDAIEIIVNNNIWHGHRDMVSKEMSIENIEKTFKEGKNLITFEYKCNEPDGSIAWYEAVVNIIQDISTNTLRIRFYNMNIDDIKIKQQKALEEKMLYESMLAKARLAYEVNITQNEVIKGHEHWSSQYGIKKSTNYTEMIKAFSIKGAHPDDGLDFYRAFNRDVVLAHFNNGERQINCTYRKSDDGIYRWVKCVLHLYEDPISLDVKGFSYVEDVDSQKKEELVLKFNAEHDVMTGLLNKITTEQKIAKYIATAAGKLGNHAYLIIDIDYFKFVNDNFGHLYGDGVIKEIAGKIKSVFREEDIIGRIGGDEFCVFIKNIDSQEVIAQKCTEICQNIKATYSSAGKSTSISASVGVALFPKNGVTYEELYKAADVSLYMAKEEGRNRFYM